MARQFAFIVTLSILALTGCDQPQPGPAPLAHFVGQSYGPSAFNQSPDNCAMSILFEGFGPKWKESDRNNDKWGPERTSQMRIGLLATPAGRGQQAIIDVRGSMGGDNRESGVMTVTAPNQSLNASFPNTGNADAFFHRFAITLAADADLTPILITQSLARPPQDTVSYVSEFTVDSLDIVLNPAEGVKPCGGVVRPEESAKGGPAVPNPSTDEN